MPNNEIIEAEVKENDTSEWTEKQRLWVDFYLQTFNKAKSARLAGYSEKCSYEIGYQNYRKLHIKAEIDRRIEDLRQNMPSEIIPYLTNQINFNIADLLDENGQPDLEKIKKNNIPGLVSSVTFNEDSIKIGDEQEAVKTKVSFKLIDQLKSVEILSKILKLYNDKNEVTINIDMHEKLKQIANEP